MLQVRVPLVVVVLLALCAGILIGPPLVNAAVTALTPASALASAPARAVMDENEALAYHDCDVSSVNVELNSYMTVYCANPVGSVSIFLYENKNSQQVNRLLATGLTAVAANKLLRIRFDANPASNPATCNKTTCRGIQSLYLIK